MDCLDKLIQLAQVSGEVNIRCLFQGQWQIQPNIAENQYVGAFHLIEQGECWLTLDKKQIHLQAGDIFFLPQNRPHLIAGQAQNLSENNVPHAQDNRSTLFKVYSIGQNSADLKMFCGLFYYSKPALLIDSLPEYLHLSLNDTPVQPLIRLMQQEADNHQSGAKSLMDALVTVLFIYILRHGLQANLLHCGLFAGLQQAWNTDALAALAAMSRANFMRVFQQKIGMAPGKFLTQLRLQEAALLLNKTQKNILSVALEVGYQSEAHFSKAFKALYGMTPSQYRKAEQV